jgi:hypothetical protein
LRLRLRGTVAAGAHGTVALTWQTKLGRRRYSARGAATIDGGRFSATLRIPKRARKSTRATLTLRYAGDGRVAPETKRLALRTR